MADSIPPPSYSQQDPGIASGHSTSAYSDPQIILVPTVDAVNFQKGYLGAEDERAAIEGEIQVKGIDPTRWSRVTVSLRTYEKAYQHEVELGLTELELYPRGHAQHPSMSSSSPSMFPSTFPFSIPLTPDTPQSIQTPHSVLGHTLMASLHPSDPSQAPISKSLIVHTRRYTSPSSTLPISPETYVLRDPTRVEIQLPRTNFTSGEDIPLYITVPPPTREMVVDRGLRIRNIRAELTRTIKVKRDIEGSESSEGESDVEVPTELDEPSTSSSNASPPVDGPSSSSKPPLSPMFAGSSSRVVIARSGASCRFHTSRPIQLRFILHQTTGIVTPTETRSSLLPTEIARLDTDAESALITQATLLHNVSFQIKVYISFVDSTTQSERISTMTIPIIISPPPAPLPQVSRAIDEQYSKKHDQPPMRTNRYDEDVSVPGYTENEAGPSMLTAPPPFEDREAPPPFFATESEASTSSRLPTFLESEAEVILPEPSGDSSIGHAAPVIAGEGTLFGFPISQQFDGHAEDMQRSSTPPPSLEMASHDTDLTSLADLHDSGHATIEAIGLVLEPSGGEALDRELHDLHSLHEPPPPPPAMDDPSDPPPSIDSAFRTPETMGQRPPTPALPPYLVPEHHHNEEREHAHGGPPPYAD
ncbi:hypothetical protein BKA70DRAFT_1138671 [Coprinopsis sp. MPI-PUGE-AT-0042]|nr:hypothetical protein BKA70DRAFT_1138671 [Coprinopsis sp. MPI-PUGE-AT-0042]